MSSGLFGWGNSISFGKTKLIPIKSPEPIAHVNLKSIISIQCSSKATLLLDHVGQVVFMGKALPRFNKSAWVGKEKTSEYHRKKMLLKERQILDIPEAVHSMGAGEDHFLFVTKSGTLFVHGSNAKGALGLAKKVKKVDTVLKHVSLERKRMFLRQVWCFHHSSFVLSSDCLLYATGSNQAGNLGLGSSGSSNVFKFRQVALPKDILSVFSIVGGRYHTFLLAKTSKGNVVFATGENANYALGRKTTSTFKPLKSFVKYPKESIVAIACCEWSSLFLSDRGNVYISGDGTSGCFGNGENKVIKKICKLDSDLKVQNIVCGYDYTFFVCSNGQVFSSGNGSEGCLGVNRRESTNVPLKIFFPHPFSSRSTKLLAAGEYHALCLRSDNDISVFSFGVNRMRAILKQFKETFSNSMFFQNPKDKDVLKRSNLIVFFVEIISYDPQLISEFKDITQWIEKSLDSFPTMYFLQQLNGNVFETQKLVQSIARSMKAKHFSFDLHDSKLMQASLDVIGHSIGSHTRNIEKSLEKLSKSLDYRRGSARKAARKSKTCSLM